MSANFPLLALKLALQAQHEPPPPPVDLSPVVDELEQIRLAVGMMSRQPRPVAS